MKKGRRPQLFPFKTFTSMIEPFRGFHGIHWASLQLSPAFLRQMVYNEEKKDPQ